MGLDNLTSIIIDRYRLGITSTPSPILISVINSRSRYITKKLMPILIKKYRFDISGVFYANLGDFINPIILSTNTYWGKMLAVTLDFDEFDGFRNSDRRIFRQTFGDICESFSVCIFTQLPKSTRSRIFWS